MNYTFSDELIAHLAKATQLAILTGTDIVDHFRMIQVTASSDGKLQPTEAFSQNFEDGLGRLQEQLKNQANKEVEGDPIEQLPLDFSGA